MPLTREQIMAETLRLHDLYYGTDHCDRKYVDVCTKYQGCIFEAGNRLREKE
jgi:hypothetical protein